MTTRTSVKAGSTGLSANHNETLARGLMLQTRVRAGGIGTSPSRMRGVKVKAGVRAGIIAT